MLIRSMLASAAVALVLAPAAFAADPAPAAAKSGDDTVICKRYEATTGSRMGGKKICKTRKEWDADKRQARDTIEDATRRGIISDRPQGT